MSESISGPVAMSNEAGTHLLVDGPMCGSTGVGGYTLYPHTVGAGVPGGFCRDCLFVYHSGLHDLWPAARSVRTRRDHGGQVDE